VTGRVGFDMDGALARVLSVLFVIAASAFGAATPAAADSVTLAWDASASADVSYYVLHVGTQSGTYTQQVYVGNVTSFTYPDVNDDQAYYFAVQAVDRLGQASVLSSEVVRGARAEAAPDWGNDGTADVVWQHQDGYVAVWHMNGVNAWSGISMTPHVLSDLDWQVVATKDMDGDGHPDLTWQHRTLGLIGTWHMNGTVLLDYTPLTPSLIDDPGWKVVASADMNGDGRNDLIWQHDGGTIAAWLMNDTTLVDSVLLSPGSVEPDTWRIAAAGDINHDGHPDLIWQHKNGMLAAWLMLGTTMADLILLNPTPVDGGSSWQIKGMADFNQDGRQDLLWQHNDGYLAVWYMDGATMLGFVFLNPAQVPPNTWQIVGPK
jgi:hypothetical protein